MVPLIVIVFSGGPMYEYEDSLNVTANPDMDAVLDARGVEYMVSAES
jgi:hypothetical protein